VAISAQRSASLSVVLCAGKGHRANRSVPLRTSAMALSSVIGKAGVSKLLAGVVR